MFKHLSGRDLRRVIAQLRFSDDVAEREGFERRKGIMHFCSNSWLQKRPNDDNPDRVTANELFSLLGVDRLEDSFVRLEKMEAHYSQVARLDAAEVKLRLSAAGPNDPGVARYKRVLIGGEDPRRRIADEILHQIPIARRHLEQGRYSWELQRIEQLNARANELLTNIHTRRGLSVEADKVLWVEGANDVPVFEAWSSKCPERSNQVVAVWPLGGNQSDSANFDPDQLLKLNSNCFVVLDSERTGRDGKPISERQRAAARLRSHGIPCLLTERRATENYFPRKLLAAVCKNVPPELDHFEKLSSQVAGYSKKRHGPSVADAMDWSDIAGTDIGLALSKFLK